MQKIISMLHHTNFIFLSGLAILSKVTAQIGAGTASSWGTFQPVLPKELHR